MAKRVRKIEVVDGLGVVILTRGYRAIIDKDDIPRVDKWCWSAWVGKSGLIYAVRSFDAGNGKRGIIYMHRWLMDVKNGAHIDHKNGNGLDCRRENLRIATHADNMRNKGIRPDNTSGIKGVSWDKNRGKWVAQLQVFGKRVHIGRFDCKNEAARAYRDAIEKAHGDFANAG